MFIRRKFLVREVVEDSRGICEQTPLEEFHVKDVEHVHIIGYGQVVSEDELPPTEEDFRDSLDDPEGEDD